MPDRERGWCAEMGRINHGWKHNLFGNEILEQYGRDPYVKALIELQKPWAHVCDRIRILLLREHGGVWLDPDCQPIRPLDTIRQVWDGPHTFVAGFRSPDRPQVALHRGVMLVDNTFLASAPDSRMVRRIMSLWRPESVVIDGHAVGVEIMRNIHTDVAMLNHRYFYGMKAEPETIVLHDPHNLGSWVDQTKSQKRIQILRQ